MKKSFKAISGIFATALLFPGIVKASNCGYEEQAKLNTEAANIKVSYEEEMVKTGKKKPTAGGENAEEVYTRFKINIFNLNENFYAKFINEKTGDEKQITFADTQSAVGAFAQEKIDEVTNYTVEIYSSASTSCPGEKIQILYLTTPRINEYYNSAECQDNESFYLCQKYITTDKDITPDMFTEELETFTNKQINISEKQQNDDNFISRSWEYIKKNKKAFIAGSAIVVAIGAACVILAVKKKRSRY